MPTRCGISSGSRRIPRENDTSQFAGLGAGPTARHSRARADSDASTAVGAFDACDRAAAVDDDDVVHRAGRHPQ